MAEMAGNTNYTVRCSTPQEREELKTAIEGLVKSRGASKVAEVVPSLVNLIAEESIDVPESIMSHVHAAGASLDVIRTELQAITKVYGTIEDRERQKHMAAAASQAERIADLEEKLRIADDNAGKLQLDLYAERDKYAHLDGAYQTLDQELTLSRRDLSDAEREVDELHDQIERERERHLETVTKLVEALGADEEQRKAILAELAPVTKGEEE